MRPRISPGDEPPFHELDEYRFQKLCRDLHLKEPGIASVLVYGVRGELQQGIDVRARRWRSDELEVGQCKRYKHFDPAQIREASDEFFAHWEYWQTQHVKRFILFVTADISSRRHITAIDGQRQRFREVDIEYETWAPDMLQNKLGEHPTIVARYLKPPTYWVEAICGATGPSPWRDMLPPAPGSAAGSTAYYLQQIGALAARLSLETERQLDEKRTAWREGRKDEARVWLYQAKSDQAVWERLAESVRAKVLRFEARVELDLTGKTYLATQLSDEAHRLAPDPPDTVLQSYIALYEDDIETALALVADGDDVEHANMRAMLLLHRGQIEEARGVLERIVVFLDPNAETYRLRALLGLVSRDLSQAHLAAQRALELGPRWENMRLTVAMVNYYSALSSVVLPAGIPATPESVDWSYVKQDDVSLAHLRAAAATFGDLAELAYDSTIRRKHLVWRLAALTNDPDAQNDALALCQGLLKDKPDDEAALFWAIAHGYPVDRKPGEKAIQRRIQAGEASINDVIVLLECRIANKEIQRALGLLERTRPLFDQNQALWETWNLQLRVLKGERKAIAAALASPGETTTSLRLKNLALYGNARRTGDWQPLREHLEQYVEITGDAGYLLELCDLLARQTEWNALADRAERLITTIGTPMAVRLAAFGLFNAGRYDVCLEILDAHRDVFQARQPPQELKRMRALCLLKLGALSEAVEEAIRLTQEAPTVENLLTLIDIYIDQGDLMQVAVVARALRNHPDLPVEQALRLAALIRSEDLALAQVFWRQAMGHPLADDLVGPAYGLGMQLNLDGELRELTGRLAELGASGRGGIRAFSIPDLLAFAQQRHEHHAELGNLYRHGDAPIHVIAELLNISLIDLYHRDLAFKENAPRSWSHSPLLARHGSRPRAPGSTGHQQTPWRLHIDITALLLAAHLDILDLIEQTFKPLRIPVGLMPALLAIRDQLPHHQPSRIDISQHIVTLVRQRRLHVVANSMQDIQLDADLTEELGESWAALHAQARRSGGYIVDFLPLTKHDPESTPAILPEGAEQYVTNCHAVIESLRQHGNISEMAYVAAIDALGGEGNRVTDAPIPAPGRRLFCCANTPEVLANAGVLDTVARHFRVAIEQEEYDQATGALLYDDQQQEVIAWVDTLIGRIRQGLETGVYQRIAETVVEHSEPEDRRGGWLAKCLTSLFAFPVQEGDVIWIDDRFANAYIHRDTAPIVDITDVFRMAVNAAALTRDQYYSLLDQLRAADVRFIPVESDEIIYALTRAGVDEQGSVLETSHLINLRHYVARCLLQGDTLQWPPLPERTTPYPNADGEVSFVLGLHHALDDALIATWATETDLDVCRARATWLVENLMFDPLMARAVLGFPSADDQKRLSLASHLAGLIVRVWGITRDTSDATEQAREAYREWLEWKLINPRVAVEPLLPRDIADILKQMTDNALVNPPEDIPAQVFEALFHSQLEWVPIVVSDELKHDHAFMERLGITFQSVVTFGDLLFDPDVVWPALETVINGEPASVVPVDSQDAVQFEAATGGTDTVVTIEHPVTHRQYRLNDAALRLLTHTPSLREEIVRQNRHWFDCSDDTFERILVEIVTHPVPRQRVQIVETWRNENMAGYYAGLEQYLRAQQTFRLEELRPASAEGLLRHFRLTQPEEVLPGRDIINSAASVLLQETGMAETLDRLARLPIPLPAAVIHAVAPLSVEEQRTLIKQLLQLGDSPLSAFHLLRLLGQLGAQRPALCRLARRLVVRLIQAFTNGTFTAYFALLVWVHELFDAWEATNAWSSETRIAMVWAHTDKLFRVLSSAGSTPEWMAQLFTTAQGRFVNELFQRDQYAWHDVANPRRQHPIRFLIAGLSYGLAESSEEIIGDRIREQLIACVFPTIGDPAARLFADSTQAPNTLNTFLGQVHADQIEQLLGSEAAALFTHSAIRAFTEENIDLLQSSPDNVTAWTLLNIGLAGQPPATELRDRILALFRQLDLVALYRTNPESGATALQTIARHAAGLGNTDAGRHLADQLVPIAQTLAESQATGTLPQRDGEAEPALYHVHQLLEACIHLIIAAYPDQPIAPAYSAMLRQIVDANPVAATICRPFVQRLCNDLPIAQAQHFWSLLVRLRAE